MQKALKQRGIDKMLEETRESNKESDAENMRRSCESATKNTLPYQDLTNSRICKDIIKTSLLCFG